MSGCFYIPADCTPLGGSQECMKSSGAEALMGICSSAVRLQSGVDLRSSDYPSS